MFPEPTNFEEAVAFEEENRRLAYLRLGRPLLGLPTGALTWRQVIELSLVRNAFFIGTEPTRDHVYQFLIRVHAFYASPSGWMPNLPPTARCPSWLSRKISELRCFLIASRASPNLLEMPIRQWIDLAFQDMPAMSKPRDVPVSIFAPRLYWYDTIVQFFHEKGIIADAVLGMPVALTFQQLRLHYIAIGDEFRCLPPSTRFKKFEPDA